jgi:hypothetical protein
MPHVKITQDELVAMARERFGDDPQNWAFQCPQCGDIATAKDFPEGGKQLGQICVGRVLGALTRGAPKYTGRGCDWCAFGLFRGPVEIVMPDGHSAWGFALAPAPA